MAGIVAVTRFCEFDGETFTGYVDYIDRDNAARVENSSKYDLFDNYLEYMGNDEKAASDEKQSNLFTRNSDDLTLEDKKQLKETFKRAQKNGSNMWQTVISFDNEYLKLCGVMTENGLIDEGKLMTSSRKAIDKMLENENLSNAVWSAAIHYNTDNIHIHIATVEPIPMREKKQYRQWEKDENGKLKTRINEQGKEVKIPLLDNNGNQVIKESYKGTFKGSSIKVLKSTMQSELENDKDILIQINNLLRGIVSDKKNHSLMYEEEFENDFAKLYEVLKASGVERRYWNYNQKNLADLKPFIFDLSEKFIKRYHEYDYEELTSLLAKKQGIYAISYGGNNRFAENKLYNDKDGLYVRLGNAILKEVQNYDRLIETQKKVVSNARKKLEDKDLRGEAIKELEEAAKQGNVYAQNKLGLMYLKGECVERNVHKAKKFFRQSAQQGNAFGSEMIKNMDLHKNITHDPLIGQAKRDIRRATTALKRSLEHEYASWRNRQSYEELQYEIAYRGEDIEV